MEQLLHIYTLVQPAALSEPNYMITWKFAHLETLQQL